MKKFLPLLALMAFLISMATAKDTSTEVVFQAEEMPLFDGKPGAENFSKWCKNNMLYPAVTVDNGVQGRVNLSFAIDTCGKLTDLKLVRGVHPMLDSAAINLVKRAPDLWKPGMNKGTPVRVMYIMPIIYQLR